MFEQFLDLHQSYDDWALRHDHQEQPGEKNYRHEYHADGHHPFLYFNRG